MRNLEARRRDTTKGKLKGWEEGTYKNRMEKTEPQGELSLLESTKDNLNIISKKY